MKQTRTVYKLRLDGKYLMFEPHGDDTQILQPAYDIYESATFETEEAAISAICDRFYFHHSCGSISDKMSAKERLSKIELIKIVVVEEIEVVKPIVYIPTNIEIHTWYSLGKGDSGLMYYLKSQVPDWKDHWDSNRFYDDDGYELADYDRIKGYNAWVAAGKPNYPTLAERLARRQAELKKGEIND